MHLVRFLNIHNGLLESQATLVWEAAWLGACFGSVWKETWNWSRWYCLTARKDEVFGVSWEMVRLRQIYALKVTFVFYPLAFKDKDFFSKYEHLSKKIFRKTSLFFRSSFCWSKYWRKKNMGYLQRVLEVPHFVSGLNFIN